MHLPFFGNGDIEYTYTITDSRGIARTYNATLNVTEWDKPQITTFSIARVTEEGQEAVDGTYARATIDASVSPLFMGVLEGITPTIKA